MSFFSTNHNQCQQLENLKRGFEWKAFNCNCWNSTNLIFFQLQLFKETFESRGVSLICNCPMLECEEHQYFPSSTLLMRLKIQYCTHGTLYRYIHKCTTPKYNTLPPWTLLVHSWAWCHQPLSKYISWCGSGGSMCLRILKYNTHILYTYIYTHTQIQIHSP